VAGQKASHGLNEMVLYESDVAKVEASLVEPDASSIIKAKVHLEESKAAHLAQHPKDDKFLKYSGPPTWSKAFRNLFLRPARPLINWVVGAERIAPPRDETEIRSLQMAAEMGRAMMSGKAPRQELQTVALSAPIPVKRKRGRPPKNRVI